MKGYSSASSATDRRYESSSASMRLALERSRLYAPANRPVLLVGSVGVGKTTLARLIHRWSGRDGNFVAVSGGEVTESLYHDRLFGHVVGAFTGASRVRQGAFERAAGGTLLIDDLAYLPRAAQSAILRTLEDRVFLPLGATREQKVTCREIFATTVAPTELVDQGKLLPDLASRLGELIIEVPPLRQRTLDLPRLAQRMAQAFLDEHGIDAGCMIREDALDALCAYAWPNNLRELKGVIERAVIHAGLTPPLIQVEKKHLPDKISGKRQDAHRPVLTPELVADVVAELNGNQTAAARQLGVHRNTIRSYLRKLGPH